MNHKKYSLEEVRLVSSESFHWTSWILDMCPNLAVSSENFHWTQALPGLEFMVTWSDEMNLRPINF